MIYAAAYHCPYVLLQELRRRFAADNSSAIAIACNPGSVFTDMWRQLPLPVKLIAYPYMAVCFLKPEQVHT
jgi:hypothetical protein